MKKTVGGWRVAVAINEEAVETRLRRSNIILCRRETLPSYRRYFAEDIRRNRLFYFIFVVTFSDGSIRERRRTKAWLDSFLSFFLPPSPTTCPCRFIFVAKRNTKFAGV